MFVSAYSCIGWYMERKIKKVAPDAAAQRQPGSFGRFKSSQTLAGSIIPHAASTQRELERLNKELLSAAKEGKVKRMENLLAAGAAIGCINEKGDTPLIEASWYGNKDAVRLLIEKKAALDIQSKRGNTALMLACDRGHYEIASMLIDAGAKLDIKDNKGWPAIIDAATNGHLRLAELLSNSGADIYALDNGGWGVEAWARENGHAEVVAWFEACTRETARVRNIDSI